MNNIQYWTVGMTKHSCINMIAGAACRGAAMMFSTTLLACTSPNDVKSEGRHSDALIDTDSDRADSTEESDGSLDDSLVDSDCDSGTSQVEGVCIGPLQDWGYCGPSCPSEEQFRGLLVDVDASEVGIYLCDDGVNEVLTVITWADGFTHDQPHFRADGALLGVVVGADVPQFCCGQYEILLGEPRMDCSSLAFAAFDKDSG